MRYIIALIFMLGVYQYSSAQDDQVQDPKTFSEQEYEGDDAARLSEEEGADAEMELESEELQGSGEMESQSDFEYKSGDAEFESETEMDIESDQNLESNQEFAQPADTGTSSQLQEENACPDDAGATINNNNYESYTVVTPETEIETEADLEAEEGHSVAGSIIRAPFKLVKNVGKGAFSVVSEVGEGVGHIVGAPFKGVAKIFGASENNDKDNM